MHNTTICVTKRLLADYEFRILPKAHPTLSKKRVILKSHAKQYGCIKLQLLDNNLVKILIYPNFLFFFIL